MERISQDKSERIWVLKAIAIFTIFFAHMPWAGNNPVMHKIFCLLGIIGVPSFLFLSGYLSADSKSSLLIKIKRLCVPLLIWATITFVMSSFTSKGVGGGNFIGNQLYKVDIRFGFYLLFCSIITCLHGTV